MDPRDLIAAARGLLGAALASAVVLVTPAAVPPVHAQALASKPIQLETGSGTLAGSHTAMPSPGRRPVLLLMSGSGPTDRDGNSALLPAPTNSLRLLAESLAEAGFASVRYDKRGVGASAGAAPAEADLRFETYAADAAQWVQRLREDSTTCAVAIVGHSEGGLLGAVAATRSELDALITVGSPARPAATLLREQLGAHVDAATYQTASRMIDALFRPSVQPYLISWFRYDPAALLAALEIPTLAVYGTTDIQVPATDAQVIQTAAPRTELLVVPGMNHVLKPVGPDPTAQRDSYSDPSLPLSPGLVPGLVEFLEQHVACGEA